MSRLLKGGDALQRHLISPFPSLPFMAADRVVGITENNLAFQPGRNLMFGGGRRADAAQMLQNKDVTAAEALRSAVNVM